VSPLRCLAIVPAFNEEGAVATVVTRILEQSDFDLDVLVVDDGSSDATAAEARAAGARVVTLPFNLGIGNAVQTGYRVALAEGYDVAMQIDGDGQHPPNQVGLLVAQIEDGVNYVVGSRFAEDTGYETSRTRRGAMRFLSRLVSWSVGQRVTDTTSGFRAADRRTIELFAAHYPPDYPEVEALILAHRVGLRIAEVPVSMEQRSTGESSITPLKSGYYMVKVSLAVLVQRMGHVPRAEEVR
jgi:glycosyltransferase involved in cell wall biosynthesis